jgi:hypothetical protein
MQRKRPAKCWFFIYIYFATIIIYLPHILPQNISNDLKSFKTNLIINVDIFDVFDY